MIIGNFLLFFAILLVYMVILFLLMKRINISNPAYLFAIYWIANILVAFVVFGNGVDWKFKGLSFLLICVAVFCVSFAFVLNRKNTSIDYSISKWHGKAKIVKYILIVCFVCGIGYIYLEMTNNGFGIKNFMSAEGLREAGYYFTDGRYGGSTQIVVTTLQQIFLTINYSGFIVGGLAFRLNIVKKGYCFIQFFPMIMSMLATTGKTSFISGVFLWLCGYLVSMNCNINKKNEKGTVKVPWIKIFIIAVIAMVLFFFSFVIRYGNVNVSSIVNRMLVYAIGHVPCYDDWFVEFPVNAFGYSHGQQTIFMLFGAEMPEVLETVYISPKFVTDYSWTNVITLFAYVIMDFGYIGGILFFSLLGIVTGIAYIKVRRKGSPVAQAVLGLCYYIELYSFLVSPIRYLSIVGAFLLFGVYLFVLLRVKI